MGRIYTTCTCKGCNKEISMVNALQHNGKYYCLNCYEEKLDREHFSKEVCAIFGLKSPGPILWTQRKKYLKDGYTDDVIIKTLKYLYNVLGRHIYSETLYEVNKKTITEAIEYYRGKAAEEKLEKEKEDNEKKEVIQEEEKIRKFRETKSKVQSELIDLQKLLDDWDDD